MNKVFSASNLNFLSNYGRAIPPQLNIFQLYTTLLRRFCLLEECM